MFSYTRDKFNSFTPQRQLNHLLKLLHKIEQTGDAKNSHTLRKDLYTCLSCFDAATEHGQAVKSIFSSYTPDTADTVLTGMLVQLEHYMHRHAKENFTAVCSRDGSGPVRPVPAAVILHNFRSAFNVGAVFRSAEYFGFGQVVLCGYTPDPHHAGVQKTAMGTAARIKWRRCDDVYEAVRNLQYQNYRITALETVKDAVTLTEYSFVFPGALLFGNEKYGLEQKLLKQADDVVNIPACGWKNSLNVAAAFAIAAYEAGKQYHSF